MNVSIFETAGKLARNYIRRRIVLMKKALMEALLKGRGSFGLPGSLDMEELEKMFKSSSRPKTAHEIELAAAMTGKESEIKYLNEIIDGFCERVAELTRILDEKTAVIERSRSQLAEAATKTSALQMIHAEELSKKEKHITNLAEGKKICIDKLTGARELLNEPVSIKDTKANLLRIIAEVKAAL